MRTRAVLVLVLVLVVMVLAMLAVLVMAAVARACTPVRARTNAASLPGGREGACYNTVQHGATESPEKSGAE
ncbi:MAG: hypothetical protein ACK40L_19810 [Hydrogenophaga sp.]